MSAATATSTRNSSGAARTTRTGRIQGAGAASIHPEEGESEGADRRPAAAEQGDGDHPLTRMYGQAHGDLVALPGGGVVATFENRYPYADGGAMLARVSWDGGQTWEPELYKLSRGHGYSGSVVLKDGTIVTLAGDGQLSRAGRPTGRRYTLQAVRWKPWPKGKKGGE